MKLFPLCSLLFRFLVLIGLLSTESQAQNKEFSLLENQSNTVTANAQWQEILKKFNLDHQEPSPSPFEQYSATIPSGDLTREFFKNYPSPTAPKMHYNWDINDELISEFFEIVETNEPFTCFDHDFNIKECEDMEALWDIGRLSLSVEHLAKGLELAGIGVDSDSIQHQIYVDLKKHGSDIALITPALTLMELASFEQADDIFIDATKIKELSILALQSIYPEAFPEVGLNSNSQSGMKTPYSLWSTKAYNLLQALENIPHDICPEVRAKMVREQTEKIKKFGAGARFNELMRFRHPSLRDSNQLFIPNLSLSVKLTATYTDDWRWSQPNGTEASLIQGIISYQAELLNTSITFTSNHWSIPTQQTAQLPFATQFTDSILDSTQNNYINHMKTRGNNKLRSILNDRSPFSLFEQQASGANFNYKVCISQCKSSKYYRKQYAKKATNALVGVGRLSATPSPSPAYALNANNATFKTKDFFTFAKTDPNYCIAACDAREAWIVESRRFHANKRAIQTSLNRIDKRLEQNGVFLKNFDANSRDLADDHEKEQNQLNNQLDDVRDKREQVLNNDQNDSQPYSDEAEDLIRKEERIQREKDETERQYREQQERLAKEKAEREAETKSLQKEKEDQEKQLREAQIKYEKEKKAVEERKRQKEEAQISAPRIRDIKCIDPEFKIPFQKKCVFKDNKWVVVTDQAAVDAMIFNKYCARTKVVEGGQCIVQGGGVIIKKPNLKQGFESLRPKKNLCSEVKLDENTTCEVINGHAVFKSIKLNYNNQNIPEGLGPRYCQQVRTAEGFECRSTDGAIVDITKNRIGINMPLYNKPRLPECEKEENIPDLLPPTVFEQFQRNLKQKSEFDYEVPIFGQ